MRHVDQPLCCSRWFCCCCAGRRTRCTAPTFSPSLFLAPDMPDKSRLLALLFILRRCVERARAERLFIYPPLYTCRRVCVPPFHCATYSTAALASSFPRDGAGIMHEGRDDGYYRGSRDIIVPTVIRQIGEFCDVDGFFLLSRCVGGYVWFHFGGENLIYEMICYLVWQSFCVENISCLLIYTLCSVWRDLPRFDEFIFNQIHPW